MKNKLLILFFLTLNVHSQELINQSEITFKVKKVKKNKIIVNFQNNLKLDIYIMNKPESGQGAFRFLTNCDTLNSISYNKPINLPPSFYSKKKMIRIKPTKKKRVCFKLNSKTYGVKACDKNMPVYVFLIIHVYQVMNGKIKVMSVLKANHKIILKPSELLFTPPKPVDFKI